MVASPEEGQLLHQLLQLHSQLHCTHVAVIYILIHTHINTHTHTNG